MSNKSERGDRAVEAVDSLIRAVPEAEKMALDPTVGSVMRATANYVATPEVQTLVSDTAKRIVRDFIRGPKLTAWVQTLVAAALESVIAEEVDALMAEGIESVKRRVREHFDKEVDRVVRARVEAAIAQVKREIGKP